VRGTGARRVGLNGRAAARGLDRPARRPFHGRAPTIPTSWRALARGFEENGLLTFASAISFRVFFALIPLSLFALGLLGFLHLDGVWRRDVAPRIRPDVSPAVFSVIQSTVTEVLGQRRAFWVTFGAAIAIWEVSGAMRAVMGVFNAVHRLQERRSLRRRLAVSCGLAVAVGALVLAAAALVFLGGAAARAALGSGALVAAAAFALRWGAAAALLGLIVALLGRFAPARPQPVRWAGFGALVVVLGWAIASALFAFYVRSVADYGSVYGGLATVFVTMEYLYISATVFVAGIQVDALVRRRVEGSSGRRAGQARRP
jgi:membrane protein